jgi:hypothetical protein
MATSADRYVQLTITDNFMTSQSSTVFHAQLIMRENGELKRLLDRVKRLIIEQIATETEAVYRVGVEN